MSKNSSSDRRISLVSLAVAPVEAGCDDLRAAFVDDSGSGRSDFLVRTAHNSLAVRMEFLNDDAVKWHDAGGVRRTLTAILVDAGTGVAIGSSEFRLSMKRGQAVAEVCVAIAADLCGLATGAACRVIVRDGSTGMAIGEKRLRFFRLRKCGYAPDELFAVREAYLGEGYSGLSYISIPADYSGHFCVRFCLTQRGQDQLDTYPELEITAYYSDGRRQTRFCRADDDCHFGVYAEVPFVPLIRGVTYLEIRCLGVPFGGFAFSTDCVFIEGRWTGSDMRLLGEYCYDDAVDLFNDKAAASFD